MRVTWGMMLDNMLAGMSSSSATMIKYQNQLATGKRVLKPSDDPAGVVRILSLRATFDQVETYLSNIAQGQQWLAVTEVGLSRGADITAQALDCARRGASDVLSQTALDTIAAEVSELIDALVSTANSRHVDRYVFAGTSNRDVPFTLVGDPPSDYAYAGDTGQLAWEMEPGAVQRVNVDGESAFGPAIRALIALRDRLLAGDTEAIATTEMARLDSAHSILLTAVTDVGAKVRRLDESEAGLAAVRHTVYDQLNIYESVDMAEAIMRLQMAEASYSAAQGATARIIRPTLVDLIR
jgi:flagellar hook-associated protein 3 FlgL